MKDSLLSVNNLKKHFYISSGTVHAVDGISFDISTGETLGLVGESGCGKSTVGRLITRLTDATAGEIYFKDQDILKLNKKNFSDLREKIQLIFQDPFSSLDPRKSIGCSIEKPLINFRKGIKKARQEKVDEMMELVGLHPRLFNKYPHELDGGTRQRVGIARALALNPQFIVCDEPVSALDVSIQAQIINLLQNLQKELRLTYLFISHDLSVVKYISNRIAVMYLGKIVEMAPAEELFESTLHPYSQALLSAVPTLQIKNGERKKNLLVGGVPSPINLPTGCRFHTRCVYATERCRKEEPLLVEHSKGHWVACFLAKSFLSKIGF